MMTCVTPTKAQHLLQYIKNRNVLEDILTLKNQPNEWIVTVAFYTALHLIESVIVSQGVVSANHKERKQNVSSIPDLNSVRNEYRWLEKASYKSRYHCLPLDGKFANDSLEYLNKIENLLSKYGGQKEALKVVN